MNTFFRTTLVSTLSLLASGSFSPAIAASTPAPIPPFYNADLVRCADSHFSKSLGTCGGDALVTGRIGLTAKATLIKADGALADPYNLYEVYWLAMGDAVTDAVPAGQFVTDCKGNARGALTSISTATDALHTASATPTVIYPTAGNISAGVFLVYSRGPWAQDTDGDCVADVYNTVVSSSDTDASQVLANPPVTLGIDAVQFLSGYRLAESAEAEEPAPMPSETVNPSKNQVYTGAPVTEGNTVPSNSPTGQIQTQPQGNGLRPPQYGQSQTQPQGSGLQAPVNGQTQAQPQGYGPQTPVNGQNQAQPQGYGPQAPVNGQNQAQPQGYGPRPPQYGQSQTQPQGNGLQAPVNGQNQTQPQGNGPQAPVNGQTQTQPQGNGPQAPVNGQTQTQPQGNGPRPPQYGQSQTQPQGYGPQAPVNGQTQTQPQGNGPRPPQYGQSQTQPQGYGPQAPVNGQNQAQPQGNGQTLSVAGSEVQTESVFTGSANSKTLRRRVR